MPNLSDSIATFTSAALSGMLTNFGAIHERLEKRLCKITGGYAVPVSTGTAAIEVALAVLGLEPGDRVLLPDFTHSGTILAVVRAGLTPVLAGVDPKTWCLRPDEVEKVCREQRIDGVIVVSPFGYEVDVLAWDLLQDRAGFALVYDFAGAFGNFPKTIAPVCYSFHATKNVGVGEGGMIVFRSERQAKHAKRLINFDTLSNREIASLRGSNSKLDELKSSFLINSLSAIGLEAVEERIDAKRLTLDRYQEAFPQAYVPPGKKFPSLCVLGNLPAEALEAASEREGIVFRRYYPLLSRMPALRDVERVSVSAEVMKNCCALPSDVDLGETLRVVEVTRSYIAERKNHDNTGASA